jgi:WD40 repeat protein
MTCRRTLVAVLSALLAVTATAADEPGSIFRFTRHDHPVPVVRDGVALSPGGKRAAIAGRDAIVVVETRTGQRVAEVKLPARPTQVRLVFAAGATALTSDAAEDTAARVWDLKSGEQLRAWPHPKARWAPGPASPVLALDHRAERMVCRGTTESAKLRVYDVATRTPGAEVEGTTGNFLRVAFSPDGKRLVCSSTAGGLLVADAMTGKKVRELLPDNTGPRMSVFATFSPDGKYVADGEPSRPGDPTLRYLSVWRVADGKRCARVFADNGFTSAAFADDGRTLAACRGPGGTFYLYDLATDTLHLSKQFDTVGAHFVTASPDGTVLAVVGTIPGADAASVHITPFPRYDDDSFGPTGPTDKELAESWDGIVGDNEFRKVHEIARLRPHADKAVALARQKVQPVPDLFRRRAEDLVENLASPDIRDKVMENLHLMAHEFEPLLESARTKAPEGDVRNRLTAVLAKMKETPPPEKLTAVVRAVEVLGQLGTPEARKVLEELAAGAAGAKVTEEAAAALKRAADKPR